MKRLLILITALLCLAAGRALAVPDTPYGTNLLPGYDRLPPALQPLVDLLYGAASRGETDVPLPAGTRYADAEAAFLYVAEDFPELDGLSQHASFHYYEQTPSEAISVTLRYDVPEGELASRRQAVTDTALQWASRTRGSALQRELDLHAQLCARVSYSVSSADDHSAYGALCLGQACCDGYARAMVLLLRYAGIPASVVSGTALNSAGQTENHAWVYAEIDGVRCLLDPTWNDQAARLLPFYLNLSAEEMGRNHWAESPYRTDDAGDGAEWFRVQGLCAGSAAEAKALTLRQLSEGREVWLRLPPELLPEVLESVDDWIGDWNWDHLSDQITGMQVFHDAVQGCALIVVAK